MQLYSPTALCPPLPELANGMISYSPDNTPDYNMGTVVTYNCNQGYRLVRNPGFLIRTCLDVGDGSAAVFTGQAPTCERKHLRKCLYSTFVNAALFSHSTMPSPARVSQWSDLLLS